MEAIETLARVLAQPTYAFRRIIDVRPLLAALFIVAVATFSSELGELLAQPAAGGMALVGRLALQWIVAFLATLMGLYLFAGGLHVAADMSGEAGSSYALFLTLCAALAPKVLAAPLAMVLRPLGGGSWMHALVGIGLSLWVLVLFSLAIREVYRMSGARAAGTLMLFLGVVLMSATFFIGSAALMALTFLANQAGELAQVLPTLGGL